MVISLKGAGQSCWRITVRNHLIESQLQDVSWISSSKHREDIQESSFQDAAQRVRGALAGWSTPNNFETVFSLEEYQ